MSTNPPAGDPYQPDELAQLPTGRHGLPIEFVDLNQRERLIAAFIARVGEVGYGNASIRSVFTGAGVASRAFYKFFDSLEACFVATFEKEVADLTPVLVEAYNSEEEWPLRVRAALAALLGKFAGWPDVARLLTVEPFAAGPEIVRRHKALLDELAPYLREGRQLRSGAEPLPETAERGILGAVNSMIGRELMAGRGEDLLALLPDLTQFALTPYLGAAAAREVAVGRACTTGFDRNGKIDALGESRDTGGPFHVVRGSAIVSPGRSQGSSRSLRGLVPSLSWLPRYDRGLLAGDLAAGVAVTAMIVPKDLGYAAIAGVPVQNGLYAAAAGAIIYALFCTSRQISTGPSSSLAAVAGGAVLVTSIAGDSAAELVAGITLVTGVLFLLLALFRMGWIAQFLSRAVVTGFLAGAAVNVAIGELPKLTGTSADGDTAWQELGSWIGTFGDFHWTTLLVGLTALAVILVLRLLRPKLPGALVLVVGGLVAAHLFDLDSHDVALVGSVPGGLPAPQIPSLDLMADHLSTIGIASVALLLIGFSQTAGDARSFAARHRYRIDVNQESVAQGMANVGAGFFQGMPVSTSLSASSLNESSGAKTPVASLTTGALVLATLVFLAPLFSDLPQAVLAAVIIDAVVFGMIDLAELRRLYRVARFDFWIAGAAILAVLASGVLAGVVIGVVLSLGWLIYVATRPAIPILGREPDTQVYRDLVENPGDETRPGLAVLRLDGGLFFATAEALEDRVRELQDGADPPLRTLVLDLEGVNFVDAQGAAKLTEIEELAGTEGISLRLARMKPSVRTVLQADGLIGKIGEDHVHGNVHRAVEASSAKPGAIV